MKAFCDGINSLDPYSVTTPQLILKSQIVRLTNFYIKSARFDKRTLNDPKQMIFSYFNAREFAKCFHLSKKVRTTLETSKTARENKLFEMKVAKLSSTCILHKDSFEVFTKKAQFLLLLCEKLYIQVDSYNCKVKNHS